MSFASRPQSRFVVLDGLRGLAAIVVVVDHVPSETLTTLLPHRALAVDFFFVLSGFVLAHAYGSQLCAKGPARLGTLGFLAIRLARLWPMLIAALGIVTCFSLVQYVQLHLERPVYTLFGSLVFGLAFLPTPIPLALYPAPFPLIGPEHTMFFELVANLAFAVVARHLTRSVLVGWLFVDGAILVWVGLHYGTLDLGWQWFGFGGAFARVIYSFFAGIAVYRLWSVSRPAPALPTWVAFVMLLLIFSAPARGSLFAPFEVLAALFLFPALVFLAAGSRAEGRTKGVFLYVGALSYGFYLLHGAVVAFALRAILNRFQIDPLRLDAGLVLLVVLGTGLLSGLLHQYYERPFRRWLAARMMLQGSKATKYV
jgi:peptidoglycan/LPS O-acetylase OafA/YrhL